MVTFGETVQDIILLINVNLIVDLGRSTTRSVFFYSRGTRYIISLFVNVRIVLCCSKREHKVHNVQPSAWVRGISNLGPRDRIHSSKTRSRSDSR